MKPLLIIVGVLFGGLFIGLVLYVVANGGMTTPETTFTTAPAIGAGRHFLDLYLARNTRAIEAAVDPREMNAALKSSLVEALASSPKALPLRIDIVAFKPTTFSKVVEFDLIYQLTYSHAWRLEQVLFMKRGPRYLLHVIRTKLLRDSLARVDAFTSGPRGVPQLLGLLAALAVPAFVIVTLVVCWRSRVSWKWKWLWLLCIAIGYGEVSTNWTTGAISANPLAFAILGAGWSHDYPLSPWAFTFGIPVGAIVFWLGRTLPDHPELHRYGPPLRTRSLRHQRGPFG